MGYERHHAIVVTTFVDNALLEAHVMARKTFDPSQVSTSVRSVTNGMTSFFVGPDGSKEGWHESEKGDDRRAAFIRWLDSKRYEDGSSVYDWAEVQYGDGDGDTCVTAHSDEPFRRGT
jgi:hypothetical protein